ncbi:hypothetical protein [Enterococcus phage vB_Efs10_KEN05]
MEELVTISYSEYERLLKAEAFLVASEYKEVGLNDTKTVFRKVFSNGWTVEVAHSLNGFGHMYDENKPYSVNVAKPSDYFLDYLTVGTPEEVKAIINEVRGYEEDL